MMISKPLSITLVLVLFLAAPARAADKPELAPLDIKIPIPIQIGTLTDLPKLPNLEPVTDKPRPPFLAPVGCKNLALKRPVTSSDPDPLIGKLAMVTDGDKQGDEWVELASGRQWVQIDLGQSAGIHAIVVWHLFCYTAIFKSQVVQVSDDPRFTAGVTTVFNSDIDNSVGQGIGKDPVYLETNQGRLIDAKGVKGRYVRIWTNGSTRSDISEYTEVEVWGR
jgi:hypothetical protein